MIRRYFRPFIASSLRRKSTYVQGQSPLHPKTREYFYYIDHQGQLFLDDTKVKNFITCFKDKKFLDFFFKRLRVNTTGRYHDDFPYVSPCGREMNYIRCDDLPVVFNWLLTTDKQVIQDIHSYSGSMSSAPSNELLSYGGVETLTVPFQPEKLVMFPESGRVYHVGPVGGAGLIKSSLAIELSRHFIYDEGCSESDSPVKFEWKGIQYALDNTVLKHLTITNQRIITSQ
jgi:hypothetical protein